MKYRIGLLETNVMAAEAFLTVALQKLESGKAESHLMAACKVFCLNVAKETSTSVM